MAEWREQAACLNHDPELWFPTTKAEADSRPARQVCAGCPVRKPCFDDAMDNRLHGIWAGTTTDERTAIRRKAARAANAAGTGARA